MDGVFDALITAAPANITRHRFAYLIVSGFGIFHEECGGLHNLAGLAITALRNISLAPSLLNRVITRGMKALDCRDLSIDNVRNRSDARTHRLLIDNNGAGATESLATAEFRTRQSHFITEKPEQWKVRVAVPISLLPINLQLDHDQPSLFTSCRCLLDVRENMFLNRSDLSATDLYVGYPLFRLLFCHKIAVGEEGFPRTLSESAADRIHNGLFGSIRRMTVSCSSIGIGQQALHNAL
jgi:hypothetical protein